MEKFKKFLPPLSYKLYKGNSGKIGIIGGSVERSHESYYSGSSALQLGADLSHIYCDIESAISIKSMQPEQIVHPCNFEKLDWFSSKLADQQFFDSCKNLQSFAIGVGFDLNSISKIKNLIQIIEVLISYNKPIIIHPYIIDIIINNPDLISENKNILLILDEKSLILLTTKLNLKKNILDISKFFKGISIFFHEKNDFFTDGINIYNFNYERTPKYIQGELSILIGFLTILNAWNCTNFLPNCDCASEMLSKLLILTYSTNKSSTLASNLLDNIYKIIPDCWNIIE